MKSLIHIFTYIFILILLTACPDKHQEAKIQVRNSITNTTMQSVKWGDLYITGSLLPGEISSEVIIYYESDYMGQNNQFSFYLSSGGKQVYLKTKDSYAIQEGSELQVTIDNDTEVENIMD